MVISCFFRSEPIFNSIIGKSISFFKWFLRVKFEDTMQDAGFSVSLLRGTLSKPWNYRTDQSS